MSSSSKFVELRIWIIIAKVKEKNPKLDSQWRMIARLWRSWVFLNHQKKIKRYHKNQVPLVCISMILFQIRVVNVHNFSEDEIMNAFQKKCAQIGRKEVTKINELFNFRIEERRGLARGSWSLSNCLENSSCIKG